MSPRWLALVLVGCRSHAPVQAGPPAGSEVDPIVPPAPAPAPAAAGESPSPSIVAPPVAKTDWCIDGVTPLDEDVCYVLPALPAGKPRRLLVYLHGIVPPVPDSPQKRTVQTVVLHASTLAGVAAIIPRGRRGIGPAQAHDWWAWPTAAADVARLAPSIVESWAAAKAKFESIAGAPFDRTYLAGSSNGAYFLTALALRGDRNWLASFPVDAFGAMSGGAAPGGMSARLAGQAPRPFYVGWGSYDEESKANARSLVGVLTTARWPVRAAEHPLGHGANEVYLDEAFDFWGAADRDDGRKE